MADRLSPSGTMLATTVVAPVPHANFTHPVTWIREQARRHGFAEPRLLAFTAMNIRGGVVPVAPHGGDGPLVHITLHLDLPQMFAARELLNYPLAANRVARHEEGHVPLWEEVLNHSVDEIFTEVGIRATDGRPTPALVSAAAHALVPGWNLQVRQAADTWDAIDYPRLHSDLARLGVPTI